MIKRGGFLGHNIPPMWGVLSILWMCFREIMALTVTSCQTLGISFYS